MKADPFRHGPAGPACLASWTRGGVWLGSCRSRTGVAQLQVKHLAVPVPASLRRLKYPTPRTAHRVHEDLHARTAAKTTKKHAQAMGQLRGGQRARRDAVRP